MATASWAEDALAVLGGFLDAHFPGYKEVPDEGIHFSRARGCDSELAKRRVTLDRLKWDADFFVPNTRPFTGGDGIFPILLKKGLKVLALPLFKLLRASLAKGHRSSCWQWVRVEFIPKAGEGF